MPQKSDPFYTIETRKKQGRRVLSRAYTTRRGYVEACHAMDDLIEQYEQEGYHVVSKATMPFYKECKMEKAPKKVIWITLK